MALINTDGEEEDLKLQKVIQISPAFAGSVPISGFVSH